MIADAYFEKREYASAINYFNESIRKLEEIEQYANPLAAECYDGIGASYLWLNDKTKARINFEKAIRILKMNPLRNKQKLNDVKKKLDMSKV